MLKYAENAAVCRALLGVGALCWAFVRRIPACCASSARCSRPMRSQPCVRTMGWRASARNLSGRSASPRDAEQGGEGRRNGAGGYRPRRAAPRFPACAGGRRWSFRCAAHTRPSPPTTSLDPPPTLCVTAGGQDGEGEEEGARRTRARRRRTRRRCSSSSPGPRASPRRTTRAAAAEAAAVSTPARFDAGPAAVVA